MLLVALVKHLIAFLTASMFGFKKGKFYSKNFLADSRSPEDVFVLILFDAFVFRFGFAATARSIAGI